MQLTLFPFSIISSQHFCRIFFFSLFIGLCLVIKMDRKKITLWSWSSLPVQRSADLIRSHSCLYSWTCLYYRTSTSGNHSGWLFHHPSWKLRQTWKCKIPQLQHYSVDCMGSFTGSGIHTSIWTSVPEWTDPRCSHLYCTYENHQNRLSRRINSWKNLRKYKIAALIGIIVMGIGAFMACLCTTSSLILTGNVLLIASIFILIYAFSSWQP